MDPPSDGAAGNAADSSGSYPMPINPKLTSSSKQMDLEEMFNEQVEPGNSPTHPITLKLKDLLLNEKKNSGHGTEELLAQMGGASGKKVEMVDKQKSASKQLVSSKQLEKLQKKQQSLTIESGSKKSTRISLEEMNAIIASSNQSAAQKKGKISSFDLMKTANKLNSSNLNLGHEKPRLSSSQLDALLLKGKGPEGPSILSATGRSQSVRLTDESRKPSGKKDGKISSSFLASLLKGKKKEGGSR